MTPRVEPAGETRGSSRDYQRIKVAAYSPVDFDDPTSLASYEQVQLIMERLERLRYEQLGRDITLAHTLVEKVIPNLEAARMNLREVSRLAKSADEEAHRYLNKRF